MRSPRGRLKAVLVAGLIACALKGWVIAAVTPAFQTPDEYGHYDYVLYLSYIDWGRFLIGDVATPVGYNDITTEELWAVTRATGTESHLRGQGLSRPLPSLRAQLADGGGFSPVDTHASLRGRTIVAPQFNYPVLYYGGAALVAGGLRSAGNPVFTYYAIRTLSLLLTLITVGLVWATAVRVLGAERWLPVALPTVFVALHPQLGMLATSVQSDVLTTCLVAGAGLVAARYANEPTGRHLLTAGAVAGALLLTKLHAAAAVTAGLAMLVAWRHHQHPRQALARLVALAGMAAAVGGWWYVRAYLLYGSLTGMVGDFRTAQFAGRRANVLAWLSQWRLTHDSFWGMWGWLEVPLPASFTLTLSALAVVSLAPLLPALRRRPVPVASTAIVLYWAVLVAAYAAVMVLVAALIGPVHNNQGRHWLPVIGPALALALGWAGSRLECRDRRLALALLATWCVSLTAATIRLIVEMRSFYGG